MASKIERSIRPQRSMVARDLHQVLIAMKDVDDMDDEAILDEALKVFDKPYTDFLNFDGRESVYVFTVVDADMSGADLGDSVSMDIIVRPKDSNDDPWKVGEGLHIKLNGTWDDGGEAPWEVVGNAHPWSSSLVPYVIRKVNAKAFQAIRDAEESHQSQ